MENSLAQQREFLIGKAKAYLAIKGKFDSPDIKLFQDKPYIINWNGERATVKGFEVEIGVFQKLKYKLVNIPQLNELNNEIIFNTTPTNNVVDVYAYILHDLGKIELSKFLELNFTPPLR